MAFPTAFQATLVHFLYIISLFFTSHNITILIGNFFCMAIFEFYIQLHTLGPEKLV